MTLPKPIALTCGEPAGIGPELAVAAWRLLGGHIPFAYLGAPEHLPEDTPVQIISDLSEVPDAVTQGVPVLPISFDGPRVAGMAQPQQAQGVIDAIETAVHLVQSGEASAICTLPIHKQALQEGAGFAYPGHTEFLSALAGGADVVMMLASEQLRVVPVTIHIPIKDVPDALTADLLETRIRITYRALKDQFGIADPRLAVAGLNPHAGEGGRMGREDLDMILPVIQKLEDEGMAIAGPMSADTMFHAEARRHFDAAICMYHDQALIPIKTLDFDKGVNVTLGLPFIRTSPDHGTAFDIAGKGLANPSSTIEALKMAWHMAGGSF